MARRLDDLDYYALLGVDPDASVDAIKAAFHDFARRYHPDLYAGDPGTAAKIAHIYRRGTEAYRVLTHYEKRCAYDAQHAQGALRLDPERVRTSARPSTGPGQPEVHTGRARPFVVKAEQALRAGDLAQARLHLQIALGHEPDNQALKDKLRDLDALRKPKGD